MTTPRAETELHPVVHQAKLRQIRRWNNASVVLLLLTLLALITLPVAACVDVSSRVDATPSLDPDRITETNVYVQSANTEWIQANRNDADTPKETLTETKLADGRHAYSVTNDTALWLRPNTESEYRLKVRRADVPGAFAALHQDAEAHGAIVLSTKHFDTINPRYRKAVYLIPAGYDSRLRELTWEYPQHTHTRDETGNPQYRQWFLDLPQSAAVAEQLTDYGEATGAIPYERITLEVKSMKRLHYGWLRFIYRTAAVMAATAPVAMMVASGIAQVMEERANRLPT